MDTSDPNILAALRNIQSTKKSHFSWTRGEPYTQPYFTYQENAWKSRPASPSRPFSSGATSSLAIYTWNIDFMLPLPTERMSAALDHLHSLIFPEANTAESSPSTPTIILLQELLASDLVLLQSTPWIQTHFHLTDLTPEYWESGYYGTATLIDKRLSISSLFRVHYPQTQMERDALFVDLTLEEGKTIRVCNTHLESLALDPPLRPSQLATAATYMHRQSAQLHAALLAGDLNAIQPVDATLHTANSLSDAFLSLGGTENSDDGYTWGQTAQTHLRSTFGLSRMDKVLFCGQGVQVKTLERFGWDVEVDGESNRQILRAQNLERPWVTDHLGLRCEFEVL